MNQLYLLIISKVLLILLQVCAMLVSRAKTGKKQSSDVTTFQVDLLECVTVTTVHMK